MKKIWKIFVGVIFLAVCSGCGIKKEQKKTIEDTKEKIYRECEMLAEGYRNIKDYSPDIQANTHTSLKLPCIHHLKV